MTITSAIVGGDNADLFLEISKLYLQPGDTIADVTYGKGAFWRKVDVCQFKMLLSDLRGQHGVQRFDLRDLPYLNGSVNVVVLDPPYMHNPGKPMVDTRYANQKTTKGMYHDDIMDLYRDGIREAKRILKEDGLLMVKCKDEIEGGRQRWSHIGVWQIAVHLGFYAKDLFILIPSSRTSFNRWSRQLHARKIHSYLWVFQSGKGSRGVLPRRYND